jgi:hypothetical protein
MKNIRPRTLIRSHGWTMVEGSYDLETWINVSQWCKDKINDSDYVVKHQSFIFKHKKDALLFKMKYG